MKGHYYYLDRGGVFLSFYIFFGVRAKLHVQSVFAQSVQQMHF